MSCCGKSHLSRDAILNALNSGYNYREPSMVRLDLEARYKTDAPVRLTDVVNLTSGMFGFFLDCRFLGYTGVCPKGHKVDATNMNYDAIVVRYEPHGIRKAFGWHQDPSSAQRTDTGNLSVDSQRWHTVSLDSFERFLTSRPGLDSKCQAQIQNDLVTLRALF